MDAAVDHLISSGRAIVAAAKVDESRYKQEWSQFWERVDAFAPWLRYAYQQMGTQTDLPSGDQNPKVESYLASCKSSVSRGLIDPSDDSTAWCSAFVNWCLSQSGYVGTNDALSTSWLGWSFGRPMSSPIVGAIVVTHRPGGAGHVGFVWDPTTAPRLKVLGGNQGNPSRVKISQINVASEQYKLAGYIWPTRIINAAAQDKRFVA